MGILSVLAPQQYWLQMWEVKICLSTLSITVFSVVSVLFNQVLFANYWVWYQLFTYCIVLGHPIVIGNNGKARN